MLQVPLAVQSAAVLQLISGLLLHVPRGHVVLSVQMGHSTTHRLHPGGSQFVVQVVGSGGLQVGATRLQTCAVTPLHV